MALIKCTECNKEISSSAKNCPSCGYKISKGGNGCFTYLLIGIGIMFFFYIIGSNSSGGNVIEDENTYSQSWREPEGTEFRDIGRIMIKNNISGCGDYHLKEVTDNEFVVACSSDDINWTYYVVYPNLDKIYSANDEMVKKLTPPH